ncbi:hypothetical protein MYX06_00045 [Patescibacteria group bacterium AH-259-L05]|nr:hypothetical protein [Patescibacteria group bacterium AH-259-L05]
MSKLEQKQCQNCKQQFTIESEDFDFYRKVKVPPPTWCPECRMIRRFIWHNEHTLYKRKDSRTGKEIFSGFSSEAPLKVWERDDWWSDICNSLEYGTEYDWNKPFFEQLRELMGRVPWASRKALNPVNSDYCNHCGEFKNCYLAFDGSGCENVAYSVSASHSRDSLDLLRVRDSELCYDDFDCYNCYQCFFSAHLDSCQDVIFSRNCVGCSNCFGCVNLKNKSYYLFNQPYSPTEYKQKIAAYDLSSFRAVRELLDRMQELRLRYPVKFMDGLKNTNVSGNYIYNSRNIYRSFFVKGGENYRYCFHLSSGRDAMDYSLWSGRSELIYECSDSGRRNTKLKFCYNCYPACQELEYCMACHTCSNCFGCVGLKNKQYCILNKQYDKKEYEQLMPKIIQHMNDLSYIDKKDRVYKYGEFFPPELSPFAYNETLAQEYFPLTKQQVTEQGYRWKDLEIKEYRPTISWKALSDNIEKVKDTVLDEIILCQAWDSDNEKAQEHNCTKAFKIIPQELQFYRRMNLPLPRKCFNSRHYERTKQRNPLKLWHRTCQCAGEKSDNKVYANAVEHFHKEKHCSNEFETTYAPERKGIVYCEKCYQSEVV